MPRISPSEFYAVPLRAHTFLSGVPLHDVWAVDLPRPSEPVTLAAFNALQRSQPIPGRLPAPARALFRLRFFLGRVLRLEEKPKDAEATSFAARLTPDDRARSAAPPASEGLFRVVYRFENEQLLEVQNRTAHAAAVSALAQTADGYRYYFAVYVAKANWLTPLYMTLIDPFRRWVVYPALLKNVRAAWVALWPEPVASV